MFLKVVFLLLTEAFVGYLLGSFNSSIIVTRLFGIEKDIRTLGSGNAGFTNVLRSVGIWPAVLTFFGDFLKTTVALCLIKVLIGVFFSTMDVDFLAFFVPVSVLLTGIFVILGHVYPCFFQFKGGKAVVCLLPLTLTFDFRVSLLALFTFLFVLVTFKMVSLSSIVGTASLPVFNFTLGFFEKRDFRYVFVTTVLLCLMCVLVVYKHSSNIRRIKAHTEYKIGAVRK